MTMPAPAAQSPCLTAALVFLARGLAPLPITQKRPLVDWKRWQTERPTEAHVREWWTRWPEAQVGVVTGRVSGLVVLDCDTAEALETVTVRCGGVLPSTPMVKTPRGWHLYFRHPGGEAIPTRVLAPKLDCKADGGCVVAPPSVNGSGQRYAWQIGLDVPLAPVPGWVREGMAVSREPFSLPERIQDGERNDALYRLARSLHAKGLTEDEILAAVESVNGSRCVSPLPALEVAEIAAKAGRQPDRADFSMTRSVSVMGDAKLEDPERPGLHGLHSIGDWLKQPPEIHDWLVDGLIAKKGTSLFYGKIKSGKSTTTRHLAYCMARGVPWLGKPTRQGSIWYFSFEGNQTDILEHFRKMGLTESDTRLRFEYDPWPTAGTFDRMFKLVCAERPDGVIIDTLLRVLPGIREIKDYFQAMEAMKPLVALANTSGAHIMGVHHSPKFVYEGVGDNAAGSVALGGSVDMLFYQSKTRAGRMLASEQRYGVPIEEPIRLLYDPATGFITAADADVGLAEQVAVHLRRQQGEAVKREEIREALGVRSLDLLRALRVGSERGLFDKIGSGRATRYTSHS